VQRNCQIDLQFFFAQFFNAFNQTASGNGNMSGAQIKAVFVVTVPAKAFLVAAVFVKAVFVVAVFVVAVLVAAVPVKAVPVKAPDDVSSFCELYYKFSVRYLSKLGDFPIKYEVGRNGEKAWVDLVIYSGQERSINFRELEKAIQISPSAINSYLTLSVIYYLRGSPGKAEFYLKQGLEYVPTSYDALLMLGRIYFEQGKIQEAKYYITRAYRLKPKDETTHYFLKLIAQREGGSAALPAKVGFPPTQAQTVESSMDGKKARRSP